MRVRNIVDILVYHAHKLWYLLVLIHYVYILVYYAHIGFVLETVFIIDDLYLMIMQCNFVKVVLTSIYFPMLGDIGCLENDSMNFAFFNMVWIMVVVWDNAHSWGVSWWFCHMFFVFLLH